ncbi:hypothetical protein ACFFK0_27835 [Paenibacillus chartarius]|uniref:Uncharacterized protein n=1 Tax=Paenibacillus chartarius TaxID=747481 RepID=A0ABV6DUL8_9BACL
MDMVTGILLLVGLVALGAWLSVRKSQWKVLETAAGPRTEDLVAKYEHLKSKQIKCKLVTETDPMMASGIAQADSMPANGALVKLKVHQAHMEQAKDVLAQYPQAM